MAHYYRFVFLMNKDDRQVINIHANTLNIYGHAVGCGKTDASESQNTQPLSHAQRFHRNRRLVALVVLSISVLIVTLILFPAWTRSLGLLVALAVLIVTGVIAFIANWRQAFEVPPKSTRHKAD